MLIYGLETSVSFHWHWEITGSNKSVFFCWLIQRIATHDLSFHFELKMSFILFRFHASLIIFTNR